MRQGRSAEQILDLVEEALDQRTPIAVFQSSVRFEQLALLGGQPPGHLDHNLDHEISLVMATQMRNALAPNAKLSAGLRSWGDLELRHPEKGRDLQLGPQGCLNKCYGNLAVQVVAVPYKQRMLLYGNDDVQVAPIPPMGTGLALACQFQAYPCFHTGRNLYCKGPLGLGPPRASTIAASLLNDAPLAPTSRAGLADRQKALRVPDLAAATAGTTGDGGCPRLRAAPFAGGTGFQPWDRNLFFYPEDRFLETDLKVVAQICATGGGPTRRSPKEPVEEILEYRPKPGFAKSPESRPFPGNSEPIVRRSLLGIVQDLIGFGRLLELLFRCLIAGVLVRVILMGQPTVGPLDLIGTGVPVHPKHFVVVALVHGSHMPDPGFRVSR